MFKRFKMKFILIRWTCVHWTLPANEAVNDGVSICSFIFTSVLQTEYRSTASMYPSIILSTNANYRRRFVCDLWNPSTLHFYVVGEVMLEHVCARRYILRNGCAHAHNALCYKIIACHRDDGTEYLIFYYRLRYLLVHAC